MEPAVVPSLAVLAARAIAIHHGPLVRLRSCDRAIPGDLLALIREEDWRPARETRSRLADEEEEALVYHRKDDHWLYTLSFSRLRRGVPKGAKGKKRFRVDRIDTTWDRAAAAGNKGLAARRLEKKPWEVAYRCPVGGEARRRKIHRMTRICKHWHDGAMVGLKFASAFPVSK